MTWRRAQRLHEPGRLCQQSAAGAERRSGERSHWWIWPSGQFLAARGAVGRGVAQIACPTREPLSKIMCKGRGRRCRCIEGALMNLATVFLAVVLVADLVGFGARPALAQTTLHRGNTADPETLDQHKTSTVYEANILRDLYEGLDIQDAKAAVVSGAAESWAVS